jgi:hypothetical protein
MQSALALLALALVLAATSAFMAPLGPAPLSSLSAARPKIGKAAAATKAAPAEKKNPFAFLQPQPKAKVGAKKVVAKAAPKKAAAKPMFGKKAPVAKVAAKPEKKGSLFSAVAGLDLWAPRVAAGTANT